MLLANSSGRALGSVVSKFKICKTLGYSTYSQLYDACVSPILNYASGVWGFKESKTADSIENRAARCFLGVHKFAPILAVQGDMGWLPGSIRLKFIWSKLNGSPWA